MPPHDKKPDTKEHYVRPDGGYGWFIVLGIFICFFCVTGIQKANGLYFVYLAEAFHISNTAISTVTFVQKIAEILTALIWSMLAERYGSRILVFTGAILVTSGFILTAFAKTFIFLTLAYGVIIGMAFPMIVFPALQTLPRYFEKRLVLASALIFCGQSAGSIVVPYIVSESVAFYGVSGSFIIVAALHLHIFIAAALLRPFEPHLKAVPIQDTEAALPAVRALPVIKEEPNAETVYFTLPARSFSHYVPTSVEWKSLTKRSESIDAYSGRPPMVFGPISFLRWQQRRPLSMTVSHAVTESGEPLESRTISVACLSAGAPSPCPPVAPTTPHALDTEVSIVQERQDLSVFQVIVGKYKALVQNSLCLLLGLSTFLGAFTISLWGTIQQAYAVDLGYGEKSLQIFLILVSSFTELVSRLAFGFVISKNLLKSYQWNQLACVLMAAAVFSYPFVKSYALLVAYNCFVAAVFSINVVTGMPIYSEFLGIDMAPIAQGLMVIPNGLGMVSVQIGGAIRDALGSYDVAFFLAALTILMSAVNFQCLHWLSVRRHAHAENGDNRIVTKSNSLFTTSTTTTTTTTSKDDRAFTDKVIESLQKGHMKPQKNNRIVTKSHSLFTPSTTTTTTSKDDRAFTGKVIESLQKGHMKPQKNSTI